MRTTSSRRNKATPEIIRITTPLTIQDARKLNAGDRISISGTIYTGRDAAHKRIVEVLDKGEDLPVDLKDQFIYYVEPSPAQSGHAIGSAGPKGGSKVDCYAPQLLERGLRGMIGKGYRSKEVVESIKKYGAVYLAATGGAAALIAKSIKNYEIVAFPDLLSEAVAKLTVEDFPAIVVIDSHGRNYYEEGQLKFKKRLERAWRSKR